MRDVSAKFPTLRSAKAVCTLLVNPSTITAIRKGTVPKADPLTVAKIAGVQAAKNTATLIPYCHQVPLDFVRVGITLDKKSVTITSEVKTIWKTGVEMEALVAVSAAALTLYDMLKIIDDAMEIRSAKLIEKRGGKSSTHETGAGLSAGVLVVSDSVSKKQAVDRSGKLLVERLRSFGMEVRHYAIVSDDVAPIEKMLRLWSGTSGVDMILTTGGTGLGPRDVTPEATATIVQQRLLGIEETLRAFGQERVPTAMLSRGIAGLRGKTIIINLPGSRGGAEDGIAALFPAILHSFRMMRGEGHADAYIPVKPSRRKPK
jgi:cyclic pyranopterin phosphate synthase